MKISVNGKEKIIPTPFTLMELMQEMQVVPELVACELNLNIVKRSQYGLTALSEGDQIEILQMIGGG